LQEINLTVDEFEAARLADLEGLYQDQAAQMMEVSRQTFGNILSSVHRKIADCLVNGKAVRIEGGTCAMQDAHMLRCNDCSYKWAMNPGMERYSQCPQCGSPDHNSVSLDLRQDSENLMASKKRCRRRLL